MDQVGPARNASILGRISHRKWRPSSILPILASAGPLVAVLIVNIQSPTIRLAMLIVLLASVSIYLLLTSRIGARDTSRLSVVATAYT